ncbi:cation diffusion facilitator family transporter [Zoogloea sp.]|uniref:cation diffusion facilitator family transporter n=1 Tax=Zoogloea sp. TaxID=49181 RepID=UPI0035B1F376
MSHDHGHACSHGHEHGHAHSHHGHVHPTPGPGDWNRAFAIGVLLNMGFVVVEAVFGWQAGSLALLADAGHNLSDVAGLILAWGAALAGRLAPTPQRTYGWRRASILAALANAVLLLVAMGALAVEAFQRLQAPQPVSGWTVIVVAAVGVLINGLTAALFMAGSKDDLNIRGAFLHMAGDALVSLGVVAAGVLYLQFGWGWLDPVISLVIAVVIVLGTWSLLRQSLHLAFDGVPEGIDLLEVHAFLRSQPGVTGVHDLHVWALGTSEVALTAHLIMPGGHPGDAFFLKMGEILVRRFRIHHPTIQIEIDGIDDGCPAPHVPS